MSKRRRMSLNKREQQNLANWMGGLCSVLRVAIDEGDWEQVKLVRTALNNQSCDITRLLLGLDEELGK